MKLTKKTKTKDVLPLLNAKTLEQLLCEVPPVPLKKPLMNMTIAEFSEIFTDEDNYIASILLNEKRALVAFGKLRQYKKEMEDIGKFMKMYEAQRSTDEERASKGIIFPNTAQKMLLDCVRFFHLHSFTEAEKIKVSEWLMVFQDEASAAVYQRNYTKLMEAKGKQKKGVKNG